MDIGFIVLIIILVVVGIYGVAIYNRLVKLKNRFTNAFKQIDVQLKRRHELIPNLVKVAKQYMEHERDTLESITKARADAQKASQEAEKNPGDPETMKKLMGAEGALTGSLGKLFALSENYPDLKANQNMMQLSEEITTTENKVSFARQGYNDSVMSYNSYRESFPQTIFAKIFGFKEAAYLEFDDKEEISKPVQVEF